MVVNEENLLLISSLERIQLVMLQEKEVQNICHTNIDHT